jgi:hypothetical protein
MTRLVFYILFWIIDRFRRFYLGICRKVPNKYKQKDLPADESTKSQ